MASLSEKRFGCRYHILPNGQPCKRCCNRTALPGWTTCRIHRSHGKPRQSQMELEI